MISLTIQAENLQDLHTKLIELTSQTAPFAVVDMGDMHYADVEAGADTSSKQATPTKSRPGRKRAADAAPAPVKEVETPAAPKPEKPKDEPPAVTCEQMVDALKKVNMAEGGGLPAVRALLGKFSAQATRDVKPDQYEAVIKAAQDWKPAA